MAAVRRRLRQLEYNSLEHKTLRSALGSAVASGLVDCALCGQPIKPGDPWHLAHDDRDRRRYAGAAHRRCNLVDAAAKANGQVRGTSRRW